MSKKSVEIQQASGAITASDILSGLIDRLKGEANRTQWDTLDVGIKHDGRDITLPAIPGDMPIEKGIEALQLSAMRP